MKKHSAKFVSGLYKNRWGVELFFKAAKQNLHIKKFYGKSENAVFTQIYIAMTAYVLFMLLKKKHDVGSLRFTHFIDMALWMHGEIPKRPVSDFERLQATFSFA